MDSRKKIRRIFWENINYPVLYSMYSKVIDLLSSSSSEEEEEEDSVVGQPKKKKTPPRYEEKLHDESE